MGRLLNFYKICLLVNKIIIMALLWHSKQAPKCQMWDNPFQDKPTERKKVVEQTNSETIILQRLPV